METIQAILLAIIQGLTEFLPISSSAHLILLSELAGWKDQGLVFDVALHFGTLLAVIFYFRREINEMLDFSHFKTMNTLIKSPLGVITIATIPIVIIGGLFNQFIEANLRTSEVIAIATIIFGVLLYLSDLKGKQAGSDLKVTLGLGFLIGLAQVFALIPGTSRSGITITAALLLGFSRTEAARFSFLLAIPAIIAANILGVFEVIQAEHLVFNYLDLFLGVSISFLVAYLTIGWFLSLIERIGMLPFVVYRVILGTFLLFLIV
ncbi:MAG TPA: undecaprenyl-diphosphate phosphatase [Gammaproteobacteria bacterium]|jgi:undecaprenyl-diphosphatase|nr:undecaprenyl-diphosphate phosphatase [Gammaproteobacteria bacterium]